MKTSAQKKATRTAVAPKTLIVPKTPIIPKKKRARVRLSYPMKVSSPQEEVFPLLCPLREFDWVPGWECEIVYSESGVAEEGCIFRTDRPADGGLDTWVVSRYEPSRRISFVRVNPLRTILYDITLEPSPAGGTRLIWRQEITALDAAGDALVQGQTQDAFASMIENIERMLEHYLTTGEIWSAEAAARHS